MSGLVISKPVYRIETKRLVIRCWDPKDATLIQEATRRRLGYANGKSSDSMIWTLFADEYSNTPSTSAALRAFDVLGNSLL